MNQHILELAKEILELLAFLLPDPETAVAVEKRLKVLLEQAEQEPDKHEIAQEIQQLLSAYPETGRWMKAKLSGDAPNVRGAKHFDLLVNNMPVSMEPLGASSVKASREIAPSGDTIQDTLDDLETIGEITERVDENIPHVFTVWFGTNRKPVDANDLSKGFSNKREAPVDQVYYGQCEVLVPKTHRFGEIGRAWWRRWLSLDFAADDHLRLQQIKPYQGAGDFWSQLNLAFGQIAPDERDAVVFLHGYNNSFEDAAIRAAQIGYDLKVSGHMAFFSWPSKAKAKGYISDGETIKASEQAITQFLLDFAQKSGTQRVHLIAHSMGNRGLLQALKNIHQTVQRAESNIRFGQIILAAPDLDAGVFTQAAHVYPLLSASTTLYASSTDLPVYLAKQLADYPRAGFVPPLTIANDIDTIEVKNFDIFNLGHGYFAEAEALLQDMFDLIRYGSSPDKRQRPRPKTTSDGQAYWLIDTK